MSRTQYLSYKLLSLPLLSPTERAVLQIIHCRPEYCLENLAHIGNAINRSARTVQRAITTLLQKGIITRVYTSFKRLKLSLVSIEEQEKIASGGIVGQLFKFCKFLKSKKKKRDAPDDTTPVSGHDTTPVSESIKVRSNKEKSILNTSLKKMNFGTKNLEIEKKRQLEAYKSFLANQ